eukprot:CAMPEP_0194742006 /NCGR_PEP_ID=MMETSP0296-20130528/98364_1 /TAXON_ID=39354 /ORGANISM="Heterosigma akashiwo, Strain CCMP2393" /LENGTH=453 /DNA_ID=CAMNT_0039653777 /DNA_START=49 /DNA_END=1410 /DNA_ORIENTATION=+
MNKIHKSLEIPLIFVHGMKGSHLKSARPSKGLLYGYQPPQRPWLTTSGLLGLSTPDLRLPLEWHLSSNGGVFQGYDELYPESVISSVNIQLSEQLNIDLVPIYGPMLNKAQKSDRPFHTYLWDWRRDLGEASRGLEAFLDRVSAQHEGAPVQVLGHSMGGLITLPVLNRRPELFAGVVFAGVPFGTGPQYLSDVHVGYKAGLNARMFCPEVQVSFSSHWLFFPEEPKRSDVLDTATGENIAIDFYNVEDWERFELGVFSPTFVPAFGEEDFNYARVKTHLQRAFQCAKDFRKLLTCDPAVEYPPITVFSSNGHDTVNQVLATPVIMNDPTSVYSSSENQGKFPARRKKTYMLDFTSGRVVPGDGRIDFAKSFPPHGIPYDSVSCTSKHMDIVHENVGELWGILEDQLDAFLVGAAGRRRDGQKEGSGEMMTADSSGIKTLEAGVTTLLDKQKR